MCNTTADRNSGQRVESVLCTRTNAAFDKCGTRAFLNRGPEISLERVLNATAAVKYRLRRIKMKSILLTAAGGRISKKHIIGKRDELKSRKNVGLWGCITLLLLISNIRLYINYFFKNSSPPCCSLMITVQEFYSTISRFHDVSELFFFFTSFVFLCKYFIRRF